MHVESSKCFLPKFCTGLENFGIVYFTVIIYQLEFIRVCHVMSGHGILKDFCPITLKKTAFGDKDPPEGKKLPNLSGPRSGPYLSKVIPSSS